MLFCYYLFFLFSCSKNKNENEKDRDGNQLKSVQINKKDCSLNFDEFFKKFSNDSIFQKSRLKLPLKYSFYDGDNYEVLSTKYIESLSNFNYIDFSKDSSAMNNDTDKFTIEKQKIKNGILYKRLGYDNGIYMTYEFKIIDGCWYLISILDEST